MSEHIDPVLAALIAAPLWACVIRGVVRDLRKSSREERRG